jgi:zinc D-Ala-D-Ala carboxypeptidase
MNISKHITIQEATRTSHNVENVPDENQLESMKLVAENCFEPMREFYGKPMKINSFFRSLDVNRLVGGSDTSQHVKGEAIDTTTGNKQDNKMVFDWARNNIEFDQLIYEFGDDTGCDWIHVSYSKTRNRKQVLRAIKQNGKTKYIPI